jgi:hypothetical protein
MNPQTEQELETEIGRALQRLPDLAAPPGFLTRTMGALEQPAAPWRLRPWARWPLSARIAFLVLALTAVAGAFAGLRAVEPGFLAGASHRLAPLTAGVACIWKVLSALSGAVTVTGQRLGKGFLLACFVAAAGACAACAGFGTFFVRFALARPEKNQL